MIIEYTGRGDRRWGFIGIGIFCGSIAAGGIPALTVGGPLWAWALFVWVIGVVALVAGVVMLAASLRRVRISFDEAGLDVRVGRVVYKGDWENVEAINVVDVGDGGQSPQNLLVLWLTDNTMVRARPNFPATGDGSRGHVLADLANLRQTRTDIEAALRKYAGERFGSPSPM